MKTRALFIGLSLAAMLLVQGTVKAIPFTDLIFTETLPTSLTVASVSPTGANVINVNNVAPDQWDVTLSRPLMLPQGKTVFWFEPETGTLFNTVQFDQGSTSMVVRSDAPGPLPINAVVQHDGDSVGILSRDEILGETFFDKARTAEPVSEPSTVALLGFSSIAIGLVCSKIRRNPVTRA